MALATKLGILSRQALCRNKACLYDAARCYSDQSRLPWNHLWRPGHYSEKDHDKIAEKYHLHPKDYKPYPPESELYLGDYPALPKIGPTAKDPYYPYDIPVYRKNYHEPLHHQFEIMGEDRVDYGVRYRIDLGVASLIFFATMAVFALLFYLAEPYKVFNLEMEKQYPHKGRVHYTFEPVK